MKCNFEECVNDQRAKGLCPGHLNQLSKGKELTTLRKVRAKGSTLERNQSGDKFCPKCEDWLPVDNFSEHASTSDGLRNTCKKCHALHKYGLNENTYQKLFTNQNGKCAVCEISLQGKKICIDHDHSCCPGWNTCGKCIRGILCYGCNTAEGLLKSDPVIISKLLEYVKTRGSIEELINE